MQCHMSFEKRWSQVFAVVAVVLSSSGCAGPDQPGAMPPRAGLGGVQDAFLQWPLPPGAEQYRDIDGRRMHTYVVELAEINRRYRDQGHPKFWGPILGTSADAESAEWVADKFRTLGLPDVRIQSLDLVPQWFAQSHEVTVSSGDTTLELESAQPAYRATATPPGGLLLDAVYVGLGNDADYLGRDVRGKAVFFYSMLGLPDSRQEAAIRRATDRGAAAIFNVHMEPGNTYQAPVCQEADLLLMPFI